MVTITNGLQTVVVSSGAYREFYVPQGWRLVTEATPSDPVPPAIPPEEVIAQVEPEAEPDDLEELQEDSDIEEPYEASGEDILLRPLGELSLDELRTVAQLKGIVTEGLRTRKEIRQAIRSAEA